jgi:hypothetical protein
VTGGAWAGGNAGPPCWAPRSGHLYPTGRRRDGHGLLTVEGRKATLDLCVNVPVPPHAYFLFRRASQGPQGRVVPFGGARQGPDRQLRTAVSSADRAESLGL